MTNPHDSAQPVHGGYKDDDPRNMIIGGGLTKRELMAIEFTKAFLSIEYSSFDACCDSGIQTADLLIDKLNK